MNAGGGCGVNVISVIVFGRLKKLRECVNILIPYLFHQNAKVVFT